MKFVDEFKEFIAQGNVMDMAVGVVIGGAFKGIVDSLVADVINPFIAFCVSGLTKAAHTAANATGIGSEAVDKTMDMSSWVIPGVGINIGNFLSTVINFLIMAFIIFLLVKGVNKVRTGFKKKEAAEEAPAGPTQEELLADIKDTLISIKNNK